MKIEVVTKPKLNITIFTNCYPLVTLTFITNQIAGLLQVGHEVTIISLQKPPPAIFKISQVDPDILKRVVYLDDYRIGKKGSLISLLIDCIKKRADARDLLRYFFKEKSIPFETVLLFNRLKATDIIHAHFGPAGNFVAGLLEKGFFHRSAFITTFHGYDLQKEEFGNGVYDRLFKVCKFFTVNSNFSSKLLQELGCPLHDIYLLPVGLDTGHFVKKNIENNEVQNFNIIFIGRLTPLKGPDRVIQIFRKLHAKYPGKFMLTIVGDGELSDDLEHAVKTNGLENYIRLAGARSQTEIISIMQQGDVFLFPGRPFKGSEETQGLVIQEAQSMGMPVVVSDIGGMKEGLVEGKTGFAIKWDSLDDFVTAIEKLYLDTLLRNNMGTEARLFVQKKFDTIVLNEKLLNIYKAACAQL